MMPSARDVWAYSACLTSICSVMCMYAVSSFERKPQVSSNNMRKDASPPPQASASDSRSPRLTGPVWKDMSGCQDIYSNT